MFDEDHVDAVSHGEGDIEFAESSDAKHLLTFTPEPEPEFRLHTGSAS